MPTPGASEDNGAFVTAGKSASKAPAAPAVATPVFKAAAGGPGARRERPGPAARDRESPSSAASPPEEDDTSGRPPVNDPAEGPDAIQPPAQLFSPDIQARLLDSFQQYAPTMDMDIQRELMRQTGRVFKVIPPPGNAPPAPAAAARRAEEEPPAPAADAVPPAAIPQAADRPPVAPGSGEGSRVQASAATQAVPPDVEPLAPTLDQAAAPTRRPRREVVTIVDDAESVSSESSGGGRRRRPRIVQWKPLTLVFPPAAPSTESIDQSRLDAHIRRQPLPSFPPGSGARSGSRLSNAIVMENIAHELIPASPSGSHKTPISKLEKDYKASSTEVRHDYVVGIAAAFVPDLHREIRELTRDMEKSTQAAPCKQVAVILEAFVMQARGRAVNLPMIAEPIRMQLNRGAPLSYEEREKLRLNEGGRFLAWMVGLYMFLCVENNPLTIRQWVLLLSDPTENLTRLLAKDVPTIPPGTNDELPFWSAIRAYVHANHGTPMLDEVVNFATIRSWESGMSAMSMPPSAPASNPTWGPAPTNQPSCFGPPTQAGFDQGSMAGSYAPSMSTYATGYHRSFSQAGTIRPADQQTHGPAPPQPQPQAPASRAEFPSVWLDQNGYDHKAANRFCRDHQLCAFCGNREETPGGHLVARRQQGAVHECRLFHNHPEYNPRYKWQLALRVYAGIVGPSLNRR